MCLYDAVFLVECFVKLMIGLLSVFVCQKIISNEYF